MNKIGGPDKIEKQKGKYMFDVKTGKKVDVTKYFTKAKSKALGKAKGYKHAVNHTTSGEKRGYQDPKTKLVYPSKGSFKDRYQK